MSAYADLERRFKRLDGLGGATSILHWDQAVIMRPGSNADRAEQLATLSGVAHEMLVAPEVADRLGRAEAELEQDNGANDETLSWRRANLALMRRAHVRATALPVGLVEAYARACTTSEMAWRSARENDDYAALLPHLAEVLRLSRERAAAFARALDLDPYDALLDEFQPGVATADIDPLFDELARALPPRVERALAKQAVSPAPRTGGPYPIDKQRRLAQDLMARIGFDFDRGRLDESTHPFCGGTPDDTRITTRYREDEVASALMGVLHETGHALYEAGLPRAWRHQPVGEASGMAAHESQSLIVEMQACRSEAFLGYLAPVLAETFGPEPGFAFEGLKGTYHRVERGLIRVDADEVTYPLHVILRYRLERALFAGDLEAAELPGAWNEGMRELLGVAPPDDRRGVLQDIHWPSGAFGYFPSYTLGAVTAAQLFQAALKERPEIPERLERGDFAPLTGWLRENVHKLGSLLPFDRLVERATGSRLSAEAFLAHLDRRYG